jgi:soluble lytic murein transglycosylase-like protein
MFDLHMNIDYAARLLRDLARRHGSMTKAIAHYHSSTDWRQEQYLAKFGSSYKRWERVLASGNSSSHAGRRQ